MIMISSNTVQGKTYIEIRKNGRYSAVCGKAVKGFPFILLIKCYIKLIKKYAGGNRHKITIS